MKKAIFVFLSLVAMNGAYAQNCVDSTLIDPNAICPFIWAPVCGCDGVTYSNDCVAENLGGVTSWTEGECPPAPDCMDLGGLDFGLCDFVLGVALVDGQCISVSGCDWVASNGIDYSAYFYTDYADCQACQETDCYDLGGLDFGECAMPLGIALINGQCTMISGCSYTANDGEDYSMYFYETVDECVLCEDSTGCMDLGGLDFGPCDAVLGVGLVNGSCQYISGCSWQIGNTDYSPYGFDDIESCAFACGSSDCIDPGLIDESVTCDFPLQPVCGCDGVTYPNECEAMNHFGVTSWTPGGCECLDPEVIDLEIFCILLYDPVCGCDSVTYSNECWAYFQNGITSWTPGECGQQTSNCTNLEGVDFGDCEMILGYAVSGNGCQAISGCSTTDSNGTDYSNSFYPTLEACETSCEDVICINTQLMNELVDCSPEWTPVCGCDGVTYNNECEALYYFGVSSWTQGSCDSANVVVPNPNTSFRIFPNPASSEVTLTSASNLPFSVRLFDLSGRLLIQQGNNSSKTRLNLSTLSPGVYNLVLEQGDQRHMERLVVE